jgi:hypothetical protein
MARFRWTALGFVAAWFALSGPSFAKDVIVKRFTSGDSGNAVGIVDASEDTELAGPQALTSDEKGNLFLLDQVNGRILRFDPKHPNADTRVLAMPGEIQPTDLVVRKSDILVWDGSIRTLQVTGTDEMPTRGLEEIHARGLEDDFAVSAFAQMGSQRPESALDQFQGDMRSVTLNRNRSRPRQFVASRGKGSVVIDVIPDKGEAGAMIEVRQRGADQPIAKLRIRVRDRLGAVEFLEIDNGGRMFVLAENVPARASVAAAFVARYSPHGTLEGVYELPLMNTPLTRRYVTISAEGDVYFLKTLQSAVEIVGVGFRSLDADATIDIRPPRSATSSGRVGRIGPISAVRPLSRQVVVETAFAFESLQWKLSPRAYGADPDTACTGFHRVRRPGYLDGKLGQQVRGIPYCWGCQGSLSQIANKIDRGVLAGNVCTHNSPRTDVAGVDCSSFVSAAWGLSTHFTTAAIPSIAKPLSNPWDLRPGDALNKPRSHVMLFLRFTPDRKAEVMEASPGACNGRVCRNVYPLAGLLARGFAPVRFSALAEDTTSVAQSAYPDTSAQAEPKAKARRKRH